MSVCFHVRPSKGSATAAEANTSGFLPPRFPALEPRRDADATSDFEGDEAARRPRRRLTVGQRTVNNSVRRIEKLFNVELVVTNGKRSLPPAQ